MLSIALLKRLAAPKDPGQAARALYPPPQNMALTLTRRIAGVNQKRVPYLSKPGLACRKWLHCVA